MQDKLKFAQTLGRSLAQLADNAITAALMSPSPDLEKIRTEVIAEINRSAHDPAFLHRVSIEAGEFPFSVRRELYAQPNGEAREMFSVARWNLGADEGNPNNRVLADAVIASEHARRLNSRGYHTKLPVRK